MSDILKSDISTFLKADGLAHCSHEVKHYFELMNDQAYAVGQVPPLVSEAALIGDISHHGIQAAIKRAFPFIDPDKINIDDHIFTFHVLKDEQWSEHQRMFVEMLLIEILPTGMISKLA